MENTAKEMKSINDPIYGKIVFGFAFLFFAFIGVKECNSTKSEEKPTKQTHLQVVESKFSSWDGSHIELTKWIKENMNDPSSFEHVSTNYWYEGDHMIIQEKIRGNNAFGAKILVTYIATADRDGNVISVKQQ